MSNLFRAIRRLGALESQPGEDQSYKNESQNEQGKIEKTTSSYIESYLNPNQKWDRTTSGRQRIDLIRGANVNWVAISDHIKEMDYQAFLATPYWKAIAAHTKYRAGYRCQLCNYSANLATHHRSYHIHGREHAHLNDLIVLCNNCHQKFHCDEKKNAPSRPANVTDGFHIDAFGLVIVIIGLIVVLILGIQGWP